MLVKEWREKIRELSTVEMLKARNAMEALSDWRVFTTEFDGFNALKWVVREELEKRLEDEGKLVSFKVLDIFPRTVLADFNDPLAGNKS